MTHSAISTGHTVEALESRIAPATAFALTPDQVLLRFDTASPGTIASAVAIDGTAAQERVLGIDYRPSDGKLYGFGEQRLYIIDPATGHAELAGPDAHFLGDRGAAYGVDFNPVPDKLRVVEDSDESFRLEPATGGRIATDTSLTSANPVTVSAVAYTNAFRGATQTTLFGIDTEVDQLVRIGGINGIPSPNLGAVSIVGRLGLDVDADASFDIAGLGNTAYAVVTASNTTLLVTIDLNTGQASPVGPVGAGNLKLSGLAVTGETRAVVTGSEPGQLPLVTVIDSLSGGNLGSFFAYGPGFLGGVRVATGDVNGDGTPDIVTAPAKGKGFIRVFDGRDFSPLRNDFGEGVAPFRGKGGIASVAVGDVDGDGVADVVVSSDKGAKVEIHNGLSGEITTPGLALGREFGRGVSVALGDVNGDLTSDVIVGAGVGAGPHVKVFSGQSGAELMSFDAFVPTFRGGVTVAAGDVNGDGSADIIAGTTTRETFVSVTDGATGQSLTGFLAYGAFSGGVRVAAGDVNGDGIAEIITGAGPGAGPHVKVFDGRTGSTMDSFFAFDPSFRGGVYVGGDAASNPNPDALIEFRTPKVKRAPDLRIASEFPTGKIKQAWIGLSHR